MYMSGTHIPRAVAQSNLAAVTRFRFPRHVWKQNRAKPQQLGWYQAVANVVAAGTQYAAAAKSATAAKAQAKAVTAQARAETELEALRQSGAAQQAAIKQRQLLTFAGLGLVGLGGAYILMKKR